MKKAGKLSHTAANFVIHSQLTDIDDDEHDDSTPTSRVLPATSSQSKKGREKPQSLTPSYIDTYATARSVTFHSRERIDTASARQSNTGKEPIGIQL